MQIKISLDLFFLYRFNQCASTVPHPENEEKATLTKDTMPAPETTSLLDAEIRQPLIQSTAKMLALRQIMKSMRAPLRSCLILNSVSDIDSLISKALIMINSRRLLVRIARHTAQTYTDFERVVFMEIR